MELVINLEDLKKQPIFVTEYIVLKMINEGINPLDFDWGYGSSIDMELHLLEQNLWIKKVEEGYILRDKGRQLFESKVKGDVITRVIEYLNEKTKRKYSIKTDSNRKFITGRLAEGYTEEDLKAVIDTMCSKWLHDNKMNMYLRPETLFNATKFQTYFNMISKETTDWTSRRL